MTASVAAGPGLESDVPCPESAGCRRSESDTAAVGFAALLDAYRVQLAALADRRRQLGREELRLHESELDRARALVGQASLLTQKPHSWTSAREAVEADAASIRDRHALIEARHALELAEGEASAARLELLWCVADCARTSIAGDEAVR